MKNLNHWERKRTKPFSRRHYKRTENILVNNTAKAKAPINRKEAKALVLRTKTQHRRWWSKNPPKDKVLSFKEHMEVLFGDDEALGITIMDARTGETWNLIDFSEAPEDFKAKHPDTMSCLPHGGSALCCTEYAYHIYRTLDGRVKIYDIDGKRSPLARILKGNNAPSGHDFAVVDDRYIVDPWPRSVPKTFHQMVFDMEDKFDAAQILDIYGDKSNWQRALKIEELDLVHVYGNISST